MAKTKSNPSVNSDTLRSAQDFLAGTPSQASGTAVPGGQQLFGGKAADAAEAAAPARVDTRGITMTPVSQTLAAQTVTIMTICLVLVVKDAMQQVPKQVYAHELPILRRIYGQDQIVEKSEEDYEVTGFNVDDEYDRLIRTYGASPGAVEATYGHNPRDLADELGLPYKASSGARKVREPEQSLIIDNSVDSNQGPTVTRIADENAQARADALAAPEAVVSKPDEVATPKPKLVAKAKPTAKKSSR